MPPVLLGPSGTAYGLPGRSSSVDPPEARLNNAQAHASREAGAMRERGSEAVLTSPLSEPFKLLLLRSRSSVRANTVSRPPTASEPGGGVNPRFARGIAQRVLQASLRSVLLPASLRS